MELPKYNLKTHTIQDWWNSDWLNNIRQQMLAGEQPAECTACWTQESIGAESHRQKTNKDYKIYEQYAAATLEHLGYPAALPVEAELNITNLCNLKCYYCSEVESSSILAENRVLKITSSNPRDYRITEHEVDQIKQWLHSSPRLVTIIGGEPLMVPEIKRLLQYAKDNELTKNTLLHITTNGTRFDQEWYEILCSFEQVRLMVSIDSVGDVNNYIRSGSKWEEIAVNTHMMSSIPNVEFMVHAVLTNLNILSIGSLIEWCHMYNYYLDVDAATEPPIMQVNNLPQPLLDLAYHRLTAVRGMNMQADKILHMVENLQSVELWLEFQAEITMRDQVRRVNILDVIPELRPYWNA